MLFLRRPLGHLLEGNQPKATTPLLPIAQTETQLENLYHSQLADGHCPSPPNDTDERWGDFVNWQIDLDY